MKNVVKSKKDNLRNIFVSTACVRGMASLESQLAEYVSASLKNIELGYCPPQTTIDLIATLKACRCRFLVHNYFPAPVESFVLNLASQDKQILGKSVEFCRNAIMLCGKIGAPFYSVHMGFRADFESKSLGGQLVYKSISNYESAYRTLLKSIAELLEYGKQWGVALLLESDHVRPLGLVAEHSELAFLVEANEIVRLMKDIGDPALGLLFDTGHLKVTATTLGFDCWEYVDRIAPYVRAFHVHDNDGLRDSHTPVAPGSWVLDILKRRELNRLPVVVEANFSSVAALCCHVDWLAEELAET